MNHGILPHGVTVVPFLDRSDLVHYTTHTVLHNLTEGIILVVIILFLFLGNVRGALIVALTIPFSLLFAATCLQLKGIPANLLSLGALDFGMVVDGAVVMVENIVRHLSHHREGDARTPMEKIREAAHEVQRPVFYAIGIIITAYLPIFTLQRVEGRLFKPMAWTVAFALLGALMFSMLLAPVLSSIFFPKGTKEWHNPVMVFLTRIYRAVLGKAIHWRWLTLGVALSGFALTIYLATSVLGSEFLPHLDEGAIWVRGILAPSTGQTEGIAVSNRARAILCSFPEVPQCTSQVGRPDDGTDTTGFFNTEYFVDLKPKEEWRPAFHQDKDELIAAMNRELNKIPGVTWGFSQPISDNMEEAVSGVKGELAIKIFGTDLRTLEGKADEIMGVMRGIKGIEDLGLFRVIGQPNLNLTVNRQKAARYQINVADVQDAVQTAIGGNALTQVLQDEQRYDLVLRYLPQFRDRKEAIENIRLVSPSGERVSLAQLCDIQMLDGASEIYREANQRYVAIKYSVRGRDLGGAVEEAIKKVDTQVKLPAGYHIDWAGEYESQQRAARRLAIIIPLTLLLIFLILYSMFKSMKWASLILMNVAMAPVGGLLALLFTGTNLSVSSGVGFLASVRRLGAGGRDHGGVHQPAARPRSHDIRRSRGRRGTETSPDHDDHAGRHARPSAGRDVARHRIGLAAAIRHCDCRRTDGRPVDEHLPAAYALRLDRGRTRHTAGARRRVGSVNDERRSLRANQGNRHSARHTGPVGEGCAVCGRPDARVGNPRGGIDHDGSRRHRCHHRTGAHQSGTHRRRRDRAGY